MITETHCICGEPLPCAHIAGPINLKRIAEYLDAYLHNYPLDSEDTADLRRTIDAVQAELKLDDRSY
jgi:hypothetical protein